MVVCLVCLTARKLVILEGKMTQRYLDLVIFMQPRLDLIA